MRINQTNHHKKRIRLLSSIAGEKIMFQYFYFSAICSLSDRLADKLCIEQMRINQTNLSRRENHVLYFYISDIYSLSDRLTDKLFIEQIRINQTILHKKESDLYLKQQTRISYFVFLHFCHLQPDRQTDGQNIFRIDAHRSGESSTTTKN